MVQIILYSRTPQTLQSFIAAIDIALGGEPERISGVAMERRLASRCGGLLELATTTASENSKLFESSLSSTQRRRNTTKAARQEKPSFHKEDPYMIGNEVSTGDNSAVSSSDCEVVRGEFTKCHRDV